jgi:hypothetical protein
MNVEQTVTLCFTVTTKFWFSLAELLLGLVGVYLSIRAAYKMFQQTNRMNVVVPWDDQQAIDKTAYDFYKDAIAKLNDSIKHTNQLNVDDYKHAKVRWMKMLLIGAVLTVMAILSGFITNVL